MSFLYKPKTRNGDSIKLPQVFDKILIGNGFWPTEGDANDWRFQLKTKLYDIYGWLMFLNMAYIVTCELIYFVENMTDVLKAVESLCTAIIGLFVALRSLHFRLVTKELKEIFHLFAKEIWIDGEKHPGKVRECHRVMRPAFVYFLLTFLCLIMYLSIPIIIFYGSNQTLDSIDKRLPYSMIFPYDVQKCFNYFLTYLSAVNAGYVIVTLYYAHDALILFFICYLCGQFAILHGDIVRLIPECHAEWQRCYRYGGGNSMSINLQTKAGDIKALQDIYVKRLHELSARHSVLISFSVQLNDLISYPLLLNVLYSTFLICCCGFQFLILGATSFRDFLLFSSFFLSVTLRLYVICSGGAMLIKYSTDTAFYLYHCNWEGNQLSKTSPLLLKPEYMETSRLDELLPSWKCIQYYPAGRDFCHKLRFMIMRSQRPAELNGMKFTVVSLEGFTKILSSSMSYFALLKTFLDKQN